MVDNSVNNPIIPLDYPDPDVIRVDDTYYMVSTSMYFMPGCEILRSYDLVNWEHACFVYDRLDSTKGQKLEDGENIYGKGMWAGSLRYHNGLFHIVFAANDTRKTYLYTSPSVDEPWTKSEIEGFYHDASLFFDDDNRVYIIYGNRQVWLTELEEDLSGPKEGGLNRIIVSEDEDNHRLGYEGAHFYKIDGQYYVFLIHSLKDVWMRSQACYTSETLTGTFEGGNILVDDRGYHGQGVAQGGIVDTPDGDWYAVLFQDHNAVGRLPVLTPLTWKDKFPVIGEDKKIPKEFSVKSTRENYSYAPLYGSEDFKEKTEHLHGLQSYWQFNHEPNLEGYSVNYDEGYVELTNQVVTDTFAQSQNMLTQCMLLPSSSAEVTVDVTSLKNGDIAGFAALQYQYGLVGIEKENNVYYIVFQSFNKLAGKEEKQYIKELLTLPDSGKVKLKIEADFKNQTDTIRFSYEEGEEFKQIGPDHKTAFDLEYFTGCRYALFNWGSKETDGSARFSQFEYNE